MKHSSQNKKLQCAVIGAGIAGIASAIRLAARGHTVHVYESHSEPGGKMRELKRNGYRFDLGPTVLTLPEHIDELFHLCHKDPRDYINYTKLAQPFRYFYEDGTIINSYADSSRFAQEIESKTEDSAKSLHAFLKNVEEKYRITKDVFIENSLHVVKNYFRREALTGFIKLRKIEPFISLNSAHKKYFKDSRVIQLFNKCANYIGSNPFVAPATLNVIHHLEVNLGVYMPTHGMFDIVHALVALAKDSGVTFHFNSKVDEIVLDNQFARGIKLNNRELPYDRIISNMDIDLTYSKLLPRVQKPRRSLNQPKSSSCIVFYWGMSKKFPQLNIHNILFSSNEQAENDSIFNKKTIYSDPTVYIGITSKHVENDAPSGCENWFTMVSAPNNEGQDWNEIERIARANVIAKLNRILDQNIEPFIELEYVSNPVKIERYFLSAKGAVFGNSSNGRFAAFLRHPNFSSRIKNLFFVGGSVHPGAGLPMALNSAKIMEKVFK